MPLTASVLSPSQPRAERGRLYVAVEMRLTSMTITPAPCSCKVIFSRSVSVCAFIGPWTVLRRGDDLVKQFWVHGDGGTTETAAIRQQCAICFCLSAHQLVPTVTI